MKCSTIQTFTPTSFQINKIKIKKVGLKPVIFKDDDNSTGKNSNIVWLDISLYLYIFAQVSLYSHIFRQNTPLQKLIIVIIEKLC